MKSLLVALVVVGALLWLGTTTTFVVHTTSSVVTLPATAPAPRASVPPPPPPRAAPVPVLVGAVESVVTVPTPPEQVLTPTDAPQIVLEEVLGPNNLYHDDFIGLSLTLPEGWKVRGAGRWGTNNHENTVTLAPETASTARPSMYYKLYVDPPPDASNADAALRTQAQQKESSRIAAGLTDYKNVPESFVTFDVNGSPAISYFATFTQGDQVMTENFIRVLGPKGYVMFFTTGKLEDVQAILPQLKQMAASIKGP